MPWYRIISKTGNKRHLWLPNGSINESALANVKQISCWPTVQKPSKGMSTIYEAASYPIIFIRAQRAKKINIYTAIQLIGDYFKVDPIYSIFENPTGIYIQFKNLLDLRPHYFSATAIKKIFETILENALSYIFVGSIPVEVFLKLNNSSNLFFFSFEKKSFLDKINIPDQDLKQHVDDRRTCPLEDTTPAIVKYLITFIQILLEKDKDYTEICPHIHSAILRCRYFDNIYRMVEESFYIDNNVINFCISLGPVGTNHLLQQIKAILGKIQKQPFDDNMKNLCFRIQLALGKIRESSPPKKTLKPMMCSQRRFACNAWCGALSPIELLLLVKEDCLSQSLGLDRIGTAAEAFVQKLPRDRIIFRRAELQIALPKSIRCIYNVNIALSHLIANGYIITAKALVNNFKPGKHAELYILNWQAIQQKIDALKAATTGIPVSPPPPSTEVWKFI